MNTRRDARIDIRASEPAKETIEKAAHYLGTTTSAFILESAMEKATMILRRAQSIILGQAEHNRFMNILEKPPKPNKALKKLVAKHKKN